MQLDRTAIAIRERGMMEILDLALHVTRIYLPQLLALFVLGVTPFFIVNAYMLSWLIQVDVRDYSPDEYTMRQFRYVFTMGLMVVLQAPLATALMTTWLGNAVFSERPPLRTALKETYSVWGRLILCQGFFRCSLTATILLCVMTDPRSEVASELVVLCLIGIVVGIVRSVRPFINEIVLLEKNPLTSVGKDNVMTIAKRNNSLHAAGSGTLFFLFLGSGLIAGCLSSAIFYTMLFFQGVLLNRWQRNDFMMLFSLPLSFWLCAGLLTVFRFLCYLDLRIRQEGWAVELRMRAEAARLQSELGLPAFAAPTKSSTPTS